MSASQLRELHTLALVIHGLIASAHCHLPKLAAKAPPGWGGKLESRVKQLSRFMQNESVDQKTFWLPYAQPLLTSLRTTSGREVILCLDGSAMGRGCMALVASVVYFGRALPVAWLVVKGKKGHLPQHLHLALIEQVQSWLSADCPVVLGDGEFDGTGLLERLRLSNWRYVMRTAANAVLTTGLRRLNFAALEVSQGGLVALPQAYFTAERYGPVLAVAVWERGYDKPLYVVSNLHQAEEAAAYYKRRFRIECFFSDSKSRGFRLDKSHLREPERLSRLFMGAVLAYWWLTYLGVKGREQDWDKEVHRASRTDLSFFQLGWRILSEFLRCNRSVPFGLGLSPTALF